VERVSAELEGRKDSVGSGAREPSEACLGAFRARAFAALLYEHEVNAGGLKFTRAGF
jgi:hypothetical protein